MRLHIGNTPFVWMWTQINEIEWMSKWDVNKREREFHTIGTPIHWQMQCKCTLTIYTTIAEKFSLAGGHAYGWIHISRSMKQGRKSNEKKKHNMRSITEHTVDHIQYLGNEQKQNREKTLCVHAQRKKNKTKHSDEFIDADIVTV